MVNKPNINKSDSSEKPFIIFQILLILAVLYFTLFFFPNITGARTPDMLQIFQVDEYAQYPHVIQMLTPGDTFYQSFRNFIIYLHYFYGYIFYFVSALVILPLKLALGSRWTDYTPLIVGFLRQGVNVAPALAAVFLLTYLQTGFRSWLRSIGIFCLLLTVPGLVANNLWWHPDSLGLLLVVLVFFFLDRDHLRFGRYFYLAAGFCGAAIGVKYLGLFFIASIPLYLIFGLANRAITWRKAILLAFGFVLVMAAAVVVTNPLLLLPQERAALIQYQFLQYQETMSGIILHNSSPFLENGQYPNDMRINYGDIIFIGLSFIALLVGLLRSSTRMRASLLLVFILPLAYTIITAATRRIHYWLPVTIPLISCLIFLFPETDPQSTQNGFRNERYQSLKRLLPWMGLAVILTQFFIFIAADVSTYNSSLNREATSPSLVFSQKMDNMLANLSVQNKKYVAYRDWHVYFPENDRWRVAMNWDLTTAKFIQDLNPDLIIFEEENIKLYNSANAQANAVNPQDMKAAQALYQFADTDKLSGYHLFYRNNFAIALIRNDLVEFIK